MTFGVVAERLLANNSEKLKLAENMQGGGHLFHINEQGEVLFRDKGLEPVMYGYDDKNKLMQIYDRNPEDMQKVKKWLNPHKIREQVLKDGYEKLLFRKDKPSTFKNSHGNIFAGFIKGISNSGKLQVVLEDDILKEFDLKEIQLLY